MRKLRWLKTILSAGAMALAFAGTAFASDTANISSCTVNGGEIRITGTAQHTEDGVTDDGNYYLFDLMPYEGSIGGRTDLPSPFPSTKIRMKIRCLQDMWLR